MNLISRTNVELLAIVWQRNRSKIESIKFTIIILVEKSNNYYYCTWIDALVTVTALHIEFPNRTKSAWASLKAKTFSKFFYLFFVLNKHICASLNNSFTEFLLLPPWMSYKPIFTFAIVIYFRESNGYNDGKHWVAFFSRIIAVILFFIELAIDGEVVFRKSNRKRGQRPD